MLCFAAGGGGGGGAAAGGAEEKKEEKKEEPEEEEEDEVSGSFLLSALFASPEQLRAAVRLFLGAPQPAANRAHSLLLLQKRPMAGALRIVLWAWDVKAEGMPDLCLSSQERCGYASCTGSGLEVHKTCSTQYTTPYSWSLWACINGLCPSMLLTEHSFMR